MTLANDLVMAFPDPPPFLECAIDERLLAEVESRYGAESPTGRSMRAMEPEFNAIHRRIISASIGLLDALYCSNEDP
jgi:hypothetical protein